jgi:CTP synthase (UTP-ammonia lyase)
MPSAVRIGLVGDRSAAVVAHRAIPVALKRAAKEQEVAVEPEWVPTEDASRADRLESFDGLWCVPGSPYRSMAGALNAIRYARENGVPFLGTCGGFQHAVLEYAQNVLGWGDATHAETTPSATRNVISPLTCGLLDGEGLVRFVPASKLATAYGAPEANAEYLCRYGVNPDFRKALVSGPLREAATGEDGDLRAVELEGHPFFVATLFQPERAVLRGKRVPIVTAFVAACGGA